MNLKVLNDLLLHIGGGRGVPVEAAVLAYLWTSDPRPTRSWHEETLPGILRRLSGRAEPAGPPEPAVIVPPRARRVADNRPWV